ncbi:MAG: hypothetical protein CFE30_02940 [Bradyrhizobium sp. PARBB1]|nr:MAG: hypothetical protein CFE30_02940 [Bradyrhizobium sp. PARBB1]
MYSATGAGRLSLGFQPVTKTGAALFLSDRRAGPGAAVEAPGRRCPQEQAARGTSLKEPLHC